MAETRLRKLKINRFVYWLSKAVLRIIGWRIEGQMPENIDKAVVIVAPHTSNWDFPLGLCASFVLRLNGHWVGKHTLFRKPFGGIMRWLGGISINRGASKNFVEQAADYFQEHDPFFLVIAPEGTRKKVDSWKSGFYHIARTASVPIICAYIDFKRRVSGIGPVIIPTDDLQEDIRRIREFYETIGPCNTENFGVVKIKGS